MKVSLKIINNLGRLIAGDTQSAPYMSGPQLVEFFNWYDFEDVYGAGFPSRWVYAADKIKQANDSPRLQKILEGFLDPRRFVGKEHLIEESVKELNDLLIHDGYSVQKVGLSYKIAFIQGGFIQAETATELGHDFISEQITKCNEKIVSADYNGAITNARTLVEAVLIHVIEEIEKDAVKNDGNVVNLWNRAKKALKIDIKKEDAPDFVFQTLSGLDTSLNGLAALSNNAGDRHANKFNTKRHHAKLAVNLAMTLSDFLIDILNDKKTSNKL